MDSLAMRTDNVISVISFIGSPENVSPMCALFQYQWWSLDSAEDGPLEVSRGEEEGSQGMVVSFH